MTHSRSRCLLLVGALVAISARASAQMLSGAVFLDRNANGARDAGERGVAGVAVSDQDTVVRTDANGEYHLNANRGTGVVFISVPDGYRSVGNFWRKAGDNLTFAVTPLARPLSRGFSFIHASDTHISQQSLGRTRRLRAMSDSIRPDFVIVTGDLVKDALR